ncbi:DUF2182 domain-containing protein [Granulicella rosea]|nr:DUF2182 domain-containing protein [Granulicella rosea]
MSLTMNPPGAWALGWAAMLVATMLPTLTAPLRHVRQQSFARRRGRSVALFLTGYGAVWLAAGVVLTGLALVLAWATPWAGGAVGAAALVWQASPAKQRCLNRGHAHPALAAFGGAADRSALRFGALHGIWCAGSCWAWMLLPMLLPRGRLLAMAAVGGLIFCERMERPERPCWKMRGLGRAVRMGMARVQTRGLVRIRL